MRKSGLDRKEMNTQITPFFKNGRTYRNGTKGHFFLMNQSQLSLSNRANKHNHFVQRKNEGDALPDESKLSNQLDASKGNGQKIPDHTRTEMENHFGADFSEVNIHTDSQAAQMSQALNAQAFTYGQDVYFNSDTYKPETNKGKSLIAHELTHVVQQRNGTKKINRATYRVGKNRVHIDYGNVVYIKANQYEQQLLSWYQSYTGNKPSTAVKNRIGTLNEKQKRWLLFGLDLLIDNPLPNLNKKYAANRLINFVPQARHDPLKGYDYRNPKFYYENEVLRVSGWYEKALTRHMRKPDKKTQELLDFAYNHAGGNTSPGGSGGSSCPTNRTQNLDDDKLKKELAKEVNAYLQLRVNYYTGKGVKSQNIADFIPIANLIQRQAFRTFHPYIGRGRKGHHLPGWRLRNNLQSSTAPGAIDPEARKAYLLNRARGLGSKKRNIPTGKF